jgi:hypothetical protein
MFHPDKVPAEHAVLYGTKSAFYYDCTWGYYTFPDYGYVTFSVHDKPRYISTHCNTRDVIHDM